MERDKNSDDSEGMNSQFLNDGSDENFEYFMKLEKEEGGVVYNGEGEHYSRPICE